jgi:hypothetical protein
MLGQMVLERVSLIEDLGVIMDQRIGFTKLHGRLSSWMLEFFRRVSEEFSPKLEYTACVWAPFVMHMSIKG